MQIPFFQIDSFTGEVFSGNPAAVCLLDDWLPDETLQSIAEENNLSETSYLVPNEDSYALRWFTPTREIDLCGHGTLAAAHIVYNNLDAGPGRIQFDTISGTLTAEMDGDLIFLDFPSRPAECCAPPEGLAGALGGEPAHVLAAERDLLAVFSDREEIESLEPDFQAIADLDRQAVIVTAPDTDADFVSRFFAPSLGVEEDPVCGSAHCTLAPYWSDRLGKPHLHARQLSSRGGELFCEYMGDRVKIGGRTAVFLEGTITI